MVISNSSPLMNLAIIGQLELLHQFYGTIHVPDAVWNELVIKGKGKPGSAEITNTDWIQKHTVKNRHLVMAIQEQLHPGESETIALALELNAILVLLDETEGRRVADLYNLNKTGVLGILLLAKKRNLILSLKDEMDKLQDKAHFWISSSLNKKLLHAAGEVNKT